MICAAESLSVYIWFYFAYSDLECKVSCNTGRRLRFPLTLSTLLTIKRPYHVHLVSISVTSLDIWLFGWLLIHWISEQLKPACNMWHHLCATNQALTFYRIASTDGRLHPEIQNTEILTTVWLFKQRQCFLSHSFQNLIEDWAKKEEDEEEKIHDLEYAEWHIQSFIHKDFEVPLQQPHNQFEKAQKACK